jgi:hypothetical protein
MNLWCFADKERGEIDNASRQSVVPDLIIGQVTQQVGVRSGERRDKIEQERLRPTFSLREKPLAKICGFLPFSVLCEKLAGISKLGLSGSLKPNFLKSTAEFFTGDEHFKIRGEKKSQEVARWCS